MELLEKFYGILSEYMGEDKRKFELEREITLTRLKEDKIRVQVLHYNYGSVSHHLRKIQNTDCRLLSPISYVILF